MSSESIDIQTDCRTYVDAFIFTNINFRRLLMEDERGGAKVGYKMANEAVC